MLPEAKGVWRWREGLVERVLAVPGEHLEKLYVYHLAENGRVWGRGARVDFPSGRVDGLLNAWLNLRSSDVRLFKAQRTASLQVPRIDGESVEYQSEEIRISPGAALPIQYVDEASRTFWIRWPPPGRAFKPIRPDEEIRAQYGTPDESETLFCDVVLPDPLHGLFKLETTGDCGFDERYSQVRMATIARMSADDPEGALTAVRTLAADYVDEGWATLEHVWLPRWQVKEDVGPLLTDIEGEFGLPFDTMSDALVSKELGEKLAERVPVRRVVGPIGLLAALLVDRLSEFRPYRICELCGRLIEGRRNKRFCGRPDDVRCFRERQAAHQRRSRARNLNTAT